MEEKILQTKKNGMTMLLLTLLGYVAAVVVGRIGIRMPSPARCVRMP